MSFFQISIEYRFSFNEKVIFIPCKLFAIYGTTISLNFIFEIQILLVFYCNKINFYCCKNLRLLSLFYIIKNNIILFDKVYKQGLFLKNIYYNLI